MYRLYAAPDFASTIPHLALTEIGAPFEFVWMDYDAGDYARPAFRAISPTGLIPAMETPYGPMFETGAILLHLSERYPGTIAPGPGQAGRARFLSWLVFTANTLHPLVMQVVHPERPAGERAAAEAGREATRQLADRLALFEAALAADPGVGVPALAFYLAVILRWSVAFPADSADALDLAPFPVVRALLARTEALPAARKVAGIEGLGATPFTAPKG